jgi:hypothetical protein
VAVRDLSCNFCDSGYFWRIIQAESLQNLGQVMKVYRRVFLLLVVAISANAHDAFLKKYCYDCHGPDKQKGDIRFDQLGSDLADEDTLIVWQGIVDQLNLGEMPPKKRELQPTLVERQATVDSMTSTLLAAYADRHSTGRQAVIRRLNKFELRNTLRDLFYLEHPDFHPSVVSGLYDFNGNGLTDHKTIVPTRAFPDDEDDHGIDTVGDALVMSDFLLKLILEAAEESIAMATQLGDDPALPAATFTAPISDNVNGLAKFQRDRGQDYDEIFVRHNRYDRIGPSEFRKGGMKAPGYYRVSFEMSGHNQTHPWGKILDTDQSRPFVMGLYLERLEHKRGPRMHQLVEWDLPPDGEHHIFSFDTWIDHTWMPWVGWENGPEIKHSVHGNLVKEFYPEHYVKGNKETQKIWPKMMADILFEQGYKGPTVRVHSVNIEPLPHAWPPKSHAALYGNGPIDQVDIKPRLLTFMRRAYRRPVAPAEADEYLALIDTIRAQGATRLKAIQAAYMAILASPDFVYLQQAGGELTGYELASRLSYFLWSSMPDDTLFALAESGELRNPASIAAQVERMLADPKAAAFTRHFPERWLQLHKLGAMAPDKKGPFGIYHRLEQWLIPQVDAYFSDVLAHNRPIREFIDSDYSYLNAMLAEQIYQRRDLGLRGPVLRKVRLDDPRRGGLFTMPAVMTVTANGVDTSPVVRGVFVLEHILGTPPPPPPPDVEPIPPDLRGAHSIREQLAIHREQDSCNSCHRKIDPLGFPLESFDPIGRWRYRYPKVDKKARHGPEVDSGTTLADGSEITGIVDFKAALMAREDFVIRCLASKMLSYATGRRIEPTDRGDINALLAQLDSKGNGLRDLVTLVATSPIFTHK